MTSTYIESCVNYTKSIMFNNSPYITITQDAYKNHSPPLLQLIEHKITNVIYHVCAIKQQERENRNMILSNAYYNTTTTTFGYDERKTDNVTLSAIGNKCSSSR